MNTQVEERSRTLVILLHAYMHTAARLESLQALVRGTWPDAEIYCPELPASRLSMADPNEIVAGLLTQVDRRYAQAQAQATPYGNIVLVGHSLGALLARKLYVVACGEVEGAPFEAAFKPASADEAALVPARPWAGCVSRIVLLAGMNRGWRVSHHLSLANAPVWSLGSLLCHVIHGFSRRWPLVFTFRRGAEFITQLRIQWLLMRRRASRTGPSMQSDASAPSTPGSALTIQLLGSRDDMVAPEDNVDLVSGGDFVYLDVPHSGHADIIDMADPIVGAGRTRAFVLALQADSAQLQREAVVPSDERFAAPDESIERVVFVMHGIRDVGYWTHKIARRIKQRAGDRLATWATETSSYGYFPMLPFLFPWYRRQKVEWLMDQYTEALARYPNASFSYVGHSNGTYLLARALELYPCCRFDRVVFAGSVVRRSYDWRRFLDGKRPRVRGVLNFVATGDWVVAFFPKFFQFFRLQDLGSAGHDGFLLSQPEAGVSQVTYVKGGHGAAIVEPVWNVIAGFVVDGRVDMDEIQPVPRRQDVWVKALGLFPPLVWLALIAAAYFLWQGIAAAICLLGMAPATQAFVTGFSFALYLLLLWLVVTRV
ncbi:hypothetical protein GLA29479_77 [Lysobacter antibioticus]|uniref:alpha/beta fold hydrolase n=1 Tax=Lysobacter antibioticus TaxID=84531 RepID=UPI000716F09E|nr:alpha/beta fold hydrolase [Lysobacter antibioticus]ALN60965.1 hypothetical protein GLA29479_77 [Lysobacter antibioticus]